MTSAEYLDRTTQVLDDITALMPWFAPPGAAHVENLAVACALAGACYALPEYAREYDPHGHPRWWPFSAGYERRDDRYGELLVAVGFALAAHRELAPEQDLHELITAIEDTRRSLIGPVPGDPARSSRASSVDALAFAGACYALPPFTRQGGVDDIPLLWPWPIRLWNPSADRCSDLVTAAAFLVAELERQTGTTFGPRPILTLVPGGRP